MTPATPVDAIETLHRRFRARVRVALSTARAYRFVSELEPFAVAGPDPFVELAAVFKSWRVALRDADAERALDAVERSWSLIEACRQRVVARDSAIEAFRVRWACENAPLSHQTIDSLARFYRLEPFSIGSQSKYEYVLTRRLAGPIGPERRLAPAEDLRDAVLALETAWGASPVEMDEREARTTVLALKSFAHEADGQADAASFTASALLRRFSAFKVGLGRLLFDPRVTVAVVETNVAVLNVLNQLLADAGGQQIKGSAAAQATRQVRRASAARGASSTQVDSVPPPSAPGSAPSETFEPAEETPMLRRPIMERPNYATGEVNIASLDLPQPPPVEAPEDSALAPLLSPPETTPAFVEATAPMEPATVVSAESVPSEAAAPPARPDLRTGEVDLSGLEFVRRLRRPRADAEASTSSPVADESGDAQEVGQPGPAPSPSVDAPATGQAAVAITEAAEQQPSARAYVLGKIEGNAALIERYLAWPRSPEVWQLDLDVFLDPLHSGALSPSSAADRRRALELILAGDDLICARAIQDDAPSAEHRAQVRAVANAMLLLRTTLRKGADSPDRKAAEFEPSLYVADHLLWERLRLEASLKRKPGRPRPVPLPRTTPAVALQEAAIARTRIQARHRRILVRIVGVAATLTTIAGLLSTSQSVAAVDPEVRQVQVAGMPGADLFDDARAYRSTLFVSAGRTWALLGREEKRSIMQGLGDFAAERDLDAVSVIGPMGEPWATYKDAEVLLDGELTVADLAKR